MNYPTSKDNTDSLFNVKDLGKSLLISAVNGTDLQVNIADATNFPSGRHIIVINNELMIVSSVTGTTLNIEQRGAFGSSISTHSTDDRVGVVFVAAHYETLRDTIIKMQEQLWNYRKSVTSLGVNDPQVFDWITGKSYIVGTTPINEWSGKANKIATYLGSATWQFITPNNGFICFDESSSAYYFYNGSSWDNLSQIEWASILNKPTTIAGFGITDTYTKIEVQTVLPKVGFDTTNTTAPSVGQFAWNQDESTLDLGLNGATLQLGQEILVKVRNNTASIISNGTVVMATGTIGNSGRITIAPHTGTRATAKQIIGVATENIAVGEDGFITAFGKVRGINTTGSTVGETWNDGDVLYLKPNDNGNLTKIAPQNDEVNMPIAFVVHSHTNGTLFVRINGVDENKIYDSIYTQTEIDSIISALYTTGTPADVNKLLKINSTGTGFTKSSTMEDADGNLLITGRLSVVEDAMLAFKNSAVVMVRNISGENRIDSYNYPVTATYPLSILASVIKFSTNDVERMRVDSNGNLLIGNTDGTNAKLNVSSNSGNVAYFRNSAGTGVYLSSGLTSWSAVSDERFKTQLTPFDKALEKVASLRSGTGRYLTDKKDVSRSFLIAQDVLKVLPEAVDTSNPNKLGVQYTDIIPLLVASIQELNVKVEVLESRLS